jgi:hypothetical protein
MRKFLVLSVVVLVALSLISPPAGAITLPDPGSGLMKFKFEDASSLYVNNVPRAPINMDALPGGPPDPPGFADTMVQIGDELRVVLNLTQIIAVPSGKTVTAVPGELEGLAYDLNLFKTQPVPVVQNGWNDLWFNASNRNPRPELTAAQVAAGWGGVLEIWYDPTPDATGTTLYNPSGDGKGPQKWVQAGGPGGRDAYPTVNIGDDATLWLAIVFVPQVGIDPQTGLAFNFLWHEGIDLSLSGLDGDLEQAWGHIVAGSAMSMFKPDAFGPGIDIVLGANIYFPGNLLYNGTAPDVGNWASGSDDPSLGLIIPEPTTLSLVGIGLVGLLGRAYRRRKED